MLYNQISSSSSDAIIQTTTQYFTVSESTSSTQSPNLTCSLSGSTLITYSLSSYNSTVIPSFVSINSTTGILTIEAPIVSNSTFNSFCIDSTISGVSGTFQETINLIVKPCTVSNCKMCTVTNSSVCATCNSGFSVSSGSWNLQSTQSSQQETAVSDIAKSLTITNQIVVGAIVVITAASSLANLSTMASFWTAINQLQLF